MKHIGTALLGSLVAFGSPLKALSLPTEQALYVAYPPAQHQTTSDRIFFIGTAAPDAEVRINGQVIENRSPAGHFAPTLPLKIGENNFTLRHKDQEVELKITRLPSQPSLPPGITFLPESLEPAVNIARLPGERICFSAVAPPRSQVSVKLADQTIPLFSQAQMTALPDNKAVLTGANQPIAQTGRYRGCARVAAEITFPSDQNQFSLGQPEYQLQQAGITVSQVAPGEVTILSPEQFEIAEVTVPEGVARTGPSTTYSRLTPLPKGTRAQITGREGDYLRLDYGGWIKADETRTLTGEIPHQSFIRSVSSRRTGPWTEVFFPLQVPVPLCVSQDETSLTLTLHNTSAHTDTIRFDVIPLIERMDWQPVLSPLGETQDAVQYTFHFKTSQQWGYKLRYDGTTLVLSLKHPPELGQVESRLFPSPVESQPLSGMFILIDPGHGSQNDLGARGPTGYPEKDVNIVVSRLLEQELLQRGARVFMTRKNEEDLFPKDRVEMIQQQEPDLAISVHYNALPDYGNALETQGIGIFWYHTQAHNLSVFLHNYLVEKLDRPSYGVFWNNLALTRPAVAPSILLELGFMINPEEFEWIVDPQEQRRLAATLADGIVEWVENRQ
ncbi:MAG: N-acetylmuramoyl-L-alanine amidase [Microcoleaceae cyanobacterium]